MNKEKLFKERVDDFWVYPKLTKIVDKRDFNDDFFSFLQVAKENNNRTNLYIHIPFCDSGCVFCPYYKIICTRNNELINEYVDYLLEELEKYSKTKYMKTTKIESIHFGGGNPLLLSKFNFKKIIEFIKDNFYLKENVSWTLEASMNSITDQVMIDLLELGFSRISLGIQTFNEKIRKDMGIKTTIDDINRCINIFKKYQFKEYCFDLMYNMPNQTMDDWLNDLEKADQLDPYHIDLYNLAIFPNTILDEKIKKSDNLIVTPSNSNQILMYENAQKWLFNKGYKQLTTNTFSKSQEKIHIGDQTYLDNGDVLGIGASSRGFINKKAYKNVCDINTYMRELNKDNFPADLCRNVTELEDMERKMVFFPIKLMILKKDVPEKIYDDIFEFLIQEEFIKEQNDRYILTQRGTVWSGNIALMFISENNWKLYIKSFLNSLKEKTNPYNEDYMGTKYGK